MNLRFLFLAFLASISVLNAADVSITAANVKPSSAAVLRRDWTAGEALTAGQLVYRSSSNFKIYKADCDSGTAGIRDCIGIAVTSAAADGPVVVCLEALALADITTGGYFTVVGVGSTTAVIAFRAKGIRSTVALP